MRGKVESTSLPEVDPTALVTAERRMTITGIDRNQGDIPEKIDPHATTTISRISTEIILESEEVLPKAEAISQGENTDKDQETSTGHTVLTVTIRRFLHTEGETGEDPPHTAQAGGTKATATTGLRDTGENHVALDPDTTMLAEMTDKALEPDTTMMAEMTDRALGVTGGCLGDREEEILESHQQGVDNLSSVRGLHLVSEEKRISNVGDVGEWATRLIGARCFRFGEENRANVDCFTDAETATVPLEFFLRRW